MTIYTNAIGEFAPTVTISREHTNAYTSWSRETGEVNVPARDYWSWGSVSDAPDHKFADETTVDEIVAALDAEGWDCEVSTNGFARPFIRATHRETAKALSDAIAKAEAIFADAERGYIRYGELPKGGRSYNYRDNRYEAGVSCIPAEFASDGSWRPIHNAATKIDQLAYEAKGVQVYRVWGTEVGTGSDGEPLLKVDRIEAL